MFIPSSIPQTQSSEVSITHDLGVCSVRLFEHTYEGVHFWSSQAVRPGATVLEFSQDAPGLFHCVLPADLSAGAPGDEDNNSSNSSSSSRGVPRDFASPLVESIFSPGFGPIPFSPLINPAYIAGLDAAADQVPDNISSSSSSSSNNNCGEAALTYTPNFEVAWGWDAQGRATLQDIVARTGPIALTLRNPSPDLAKYLAPPGLRTPFSLQPEQLQQMQQPQQQQLPLLPLQDQQPQAQWGPEQDGFAQYRGREGRGAFSGRQQQQQQEEEEEEEENNAGNITTEAPDGSAFGFFGGAGEEDDACDSNTNTANDDDGERVAVAVPVALGPSTAALVAGTAAAGGTYERDVRQNNTITPGIQMGDVDLAVSRYFKPKAPRRPRISLANTTTTTTTVAAVPGYSSNNNTTTDSNVLGQRLGSGGGRSLGVPIPSLITPVSRGPTISAFTQSMPILQGNTTTTTTTTTTATTTTTTTATQLGSRHHHHHQQQQRQQEGLGMSLLGGSGMITTASAAAPTATTTGTGTTTVVAATAAGTMPGPGFGPIRTGISGSGNSSSSSGGTGKRPSINHSRKKISEPGGMHTCQWEGCSMSFETVSELTNHLQMCHTSVQTVYKCMWKGCGRNGKPFGNHSGLFRHLRYHTGDKPCKCTFEGCGFSSVDNGELRRHIKLVHHHNENPWP